MCKLLYRHNFAFSLWKVTEIKQSLGLSWQAMLSPTAVRRLPVGKPVFGVNPKIYVNFMNFLTITVGSIHLIRRWLFYLSSKANGSKSIKYDLRLIYNFDTITVRARQEVLAK
jgi:hypothetical protein